MLTAQHSDSTSSAIQSTHGVTEMIEDTRFFLFFFFKKTPPFPVMSYVVLRDIYQNKNK